MAVNRNVHLVGSVPLPSSAAVFDIVGDKIGALAKRVPDGETGARSGWIGWQNDVLARSTGIAPGSTRVFQGMDIQLYRIVGTPKNVELLPLGYAEMALASYRDFAKARDAGKIAKHARFQVSLPTPFAVAFFYFEDEFVEPAWRLYEASMLDELAQIVAGIPNRELAIQWDIAVEITMALEAPDVAAKFPMDELVEAIARVSAKIPAEIELGMHLCYGDPDGTHVVEPKDTGLMVDLSNRLIAAIDRPIMWLHMPVPIGRDDAAYFQPLQGLHRPDGCDLFLGLVHLSDGAAGARRRLAAAKAVLEDEFGVATECGLGRRPPDVIPDLLALHTTVAQIEV